MKRILKATWTLVAAAAIGLSSFAPDAEALLFRPDLRIQKVTPYGGLLVLKITNEGLAHAPACRARMRINGGASRYVAVPPIAVGKSVNVWFDVGSGMIWSCQNEFGFQVDSGNAVIEADETDNTKTWYSGPC